MRDRERGRDTGRGRSRLPQGEALIIEPNGGLNPRTPDHDLSQRQIVNYQATQVPLIFYYKV